MRGHTADKCDEGVEHALHDDGGIERAVVGEFECEKPLLSGCHGDAEFVEDLLFALSHLESPLLLSAGQCVGAGVILKGENGLEEIGAEWRLCLDVGERAEVVGCGLGRLCL